ncbi:MAG: pro-sigmaK processing inhibitor BofA family protein [Firmicutes bacterium]|nr:pro-sigmaK processing inhibitor BofA family protein [Candidatus Fermentithermobacillaceae bacterium]
MDLNALLGIAVAAVVLVYLLKALKGALVVLGKVALRTLVAFAGIWAFNVLAGLFGIHMGLNLISALTIALLGLPGIALLFAVKYLL